MDNDHAHKIKASSIFEETKKSNTLRWTLTREAYWIRTSDPYPVKVVL